ncbi:MAG: hypothetical protein HKO59_16625 [Phycisphaerales bacterium]|nr:hypothetical protein [Phycisphaerae bacterium]NNF42180.1 hypothetical protein [Phycisphaerales bacterium]NNM27575.1 hypothetical protein [Phycisphaerales bacterium]
MRIDHHAFQRATRVAGFGFLVQLGIGLTILIFSLVGGETVPQDTAFLFGSIWILLGLPVWLGLIILFNQHKLEQLEALEEDELAATRGGDAESVFAADEEIRVAARRLRLMHNWLMPILSLLITLGLGGSAWLMLRHLGRVANDQAEFLITPHVGWAVAIALAFSAVSFIVSRFVAGMAKQPAWQNLRGGAAYMVGNSLVTLAIAVGIGFRFFKNDEIIVAIAYAIPIFLIVVAAEILLNFILNLYRPRVADETTRPAFDSKLLSLFAAPDNLVRSINEAINYQFGFDITSSWGYQLLLRSFAWLLGLGVAALVVLNMIVIVEPHQQAVKLSRGEMVGSVHGSGVMLKLPWPFQSAEIYDVTSVRALPLTGRQVTSTGADAVQLWTDDLGRKFDAPLDPFLVRASAVDLDEFSALREQNVEIGEEQEAQLTRDFSLLDAEIVLQYRIKEDGGLLDYLRFSDLQAGRRQRLTMRQAALKSIALREIALELSGVQLDQVLGADRSVVAERLRSEIQAAFDAQKAGIDLVAVNLPLMRPAGEASAGFEELSVSNQARDQFIANARQEVVAGLAQLIGDPDRVEQIAAEIDRYNEMRHTRRQEKGEADPALVAQRVRIEQLLAETGGLANEEIVQAERDRWVSLMEARTQASRLRGQLASYRAAPNLYQERETMLVYGNALGELYKYVIGIDPARVDFDIELRELNPMFNFADALDAEERGSGQ